MAKPNYNLARRQREAARKARQEARLARRQPRPDIGAPAGTGTGDDGAAAVPPRGTRT